MTKPAIDWIKEISEPHLREFLLKYAELYPNSRIKNVSNIWDAINEGIDFSETPQGNVWWCNIFCTESWVTFYERYPIPTVFDYELMAKEFGSVVNNSKQANIDTLKFLIANPDIDLRELLKNIEKF